MVRVKQKMKKNDLQAVSNCLPVNYFLNEHLFRNVFRKFIQMKTKRSLLFFTAFFSVFLSFAQDPFALQPLKFGKTAHFGLNRTIAVPAPVLTFKATEEHAPAAFDPEVHYPAFFCRMELKAVKHFGVWIKVHAGDYDRYSREYR